MGIYISGVKGLPEQVQANKEDIKEVKEQIEGIDFDSIRQLQGQVAENTQDINNLEASIGVQNQTINALGDRTTALERKTQKITYDENEDETTIDSDVIIGDDLDVKNVHVAGNGTFQNENGSGLHFQEGANDDTLTIANNDGANRHYLQLDGDGNLTLDGNPVGSKTYYNHIIKLFTSLGVTTVINIINSESGAFSNPAQIATLLYNNGLRDQSAFYNCQCRLVGNKKFAKGVYASSNASTGLKVYVQDVDTDVVQELQVATIVEVGAVPIV